MNALDYIQQKYVLDLKRHSPIDVPANRHDLAQLFAELNFTKGAEVGVEQGEYSEVLCKANPNLILICVDAWKAYKEYREHVTQEKLDGFYARTKERLATYNCLFIRQMSTLAAHAIDDRTLDFVYIDANHRYEQVVADLAAWSRKVRKGGIVAGHDYRKVKGNGPFHVPQALQGWTSAYNISPWFVFRGDKSASWCYVVQ